MNETVTKADKPTAEEAVDDYGLWVKRTAMHLNHLMPWADAEELIQWGVVGLLEARERFDPARGAPFSAFAKRRIRGAMLDSLRRHGNQARRVGKAPGKIADNTFGQSAVFDDPLDELMKHADDAALTQAVATLSERSQLILHLFFVEELNNREIARVLKVSEAYVSKARRKSLEQLAGQLDPAARLAGDRP